MTETSRVWGGTTPGDAGPYTLDHWADIWDSFFNKRALNGGVFRGDRGELAVSGTGSPVTVQAGTALVNGTWYDENTSTTIAIPTPSGATRIDLIVLRKSWSAQTIRLTRVAGVEGGGVPALTQSAATTWDIPIAQCSITTGGVITVTDTRVFCQFAMEKSNAPAEGRLTLTTLTPVTTADVTSATTIIYTPYIGNKIALYNGAGWDIVTFPEISLALGTLTGSIGYDVFVYNNGGAAALEFAAWASATARTTNLVLQDGILCKTGALTRRYVGSFYTQTATTTEDSKTRRLLWNYYNRVPRFLQCADTTDSWTYTTATWRAADANTTEGQGRVTCFIGWLETEVNAYRIGSVTNNSVNTGYDAAVGVGIDVTNANSAQITGVKAITGGSGGGTSVSAVYKGYPAIGFHFLQSLEIAAAVSTTTWYGDNGETYFQSGMVAELNA